MSSICDDLRAAILQAAMQGKLTEQLPEDGDVEGLLSQIKAKKEKLIAEGKIKKQKQLAPITDDEIPFNIPENWKWVKLADISTYKMGKTPQRSDETYWKDDFAWVSIADMPENGTLERTKEKISQKALSEKFNNSLVPKGTLIMSFKLTVGRCSILGIDAVHNEAIISIFPYIDTNNSTRDYLFATLPFLSNFGDSKDAIKGKTLNNSSLSNLLVPLPPLAEQKRIVEKVDDLMARVADLEQSADALASLKKAFPDDIKASLLQAAMQGKLTEQLPEDGDAEELLDQIKAEKERLIAEGKNKKQKPLAPITDDEIPFNIPDNWKWSKLGEMVIVLGGKRIPAGKKLTKNNTGHIYIRVSDMKDNTVSTNDLQYVPEDIYPGISRYIINKDDVYITVAGTIGRVGKIPPELDGANLTENADRLVFSRINQDWLIWCLNSPIAQNQIYDATTQVGQPKLAIKRIEELLIPLPPLNEQKRIVERLDALMQNINVVGELIANK
ncbi:restriction endonuclease subunit S [Candidatus Saccharibacteria bacterium]|nr:restriction endonuclease subunit S [Candidatus Saccharibacteria bacterium]